MAYFGHHLRNFLYVLLFMCSTVLLGLTAYRIHYTRNTAGDILANRSYYYDRIIVELLVTSVLTIPFTLWILSTIFKRHVTGNARHHMIELILLSILWAMFLVGAIITTRHWYHLKWCRGFFKQCRILETIKAFSWICWILTTFLIPLSLLRMRRAPEDDHMGTRRNVVNGNRAGETKGLRHEPAVTV